MNEVTLIRRTHQDGPKASEAVYSSCLTYRYSLTRIWDNSVARLGYVMLNPSTADEKSNDPTIERCERRAKALGYGAIQITNLFAFRATSPKDLKAAKHPFGQDNLRILTSSFDWSDNVIAAWGVHGTHREADAIAKRQLAETSTPILHLGLTKDGHPRHPLYVPYAQPPVRWDFD